MLRARLRDLEIVVSRVHGRGETGFKGSFRHTQGARCRTHIHFMKIEQNHWLAIADGQRQYSAPEHLVPFSFPDFEELGCGVRRLGYVINVHGDGGKAFELGAEKVGGEGEEPGGEAGLLPPLGEATPGTEKGLLGHFFGSAAVAAVAPCHIHERTLPAADDAFEGLDFTGEYAGDVGEIFCRAGRGCSQFARSP